MRIDRKAIKRLARENMRGAKPSALVVTLVFVLLTSGIGLLVNFITSNPAAEMINYLDVLTRLTGDITPEEILGLFTTLGVGLPILTMFLSILLTLYNMVMGFGYDAYTLHMSRGGKAGYHDLMVGFGMIGRVLAANLLVAIFSFLWSGLVILVTAVLIGIVVAVIINVMGAAGTWLAIGLTFVIWLAAWVVIYIIVLRYSLTNYALLDHPEQGSFAALTRSKGLMRGVKGQYFVMELSFIGWELLQGLIVGVMISIGVSVSIFVSIGTGDYNALLLSVGLTMLLTSIAAVPLMLWLYPYRKITCAHFYGALAGATPASSMEAGTL